MICWFWTQILISSRPCSSTMELRFYLETLESLYISIPLLADLWQSRLLCGPSAVSLIVGLEYTLLRVHRVRKLLFDDAQNWTWDLTNAKLVFCRAYLLISSTHRKTKERVQSVNYLVYKHEDLSLRSCLPPGISWEDGDRQTDLQA